MYNNIFTIGSFTIYGYGLMIGIGVLFGIWMVIRRAKKRDMDTDLIFNFCLQTLVYGFLGAKLLYIIIEYKEFIQNPLTILSSGGFVVFGGILSGLLAAVIFCRKKNVSFLQHLDLLVPSVALAQGFGRIGCFLAGCCYGSETDSFFGIVFRHSDFAPNNVKLIPTQLLMSFGDFIIVLILLLYAKKNRKMGRIGGLYLILYSIGRFAIEFFRDDYRGSIGILSVSQFISLFTLVGGILLFFIKFKPFVKKKPLNRVEVNAATPPVKIKEDAVNGKEPSEEEKAEENIPEEMKENPEKPTKDPENPAENS
jgi:phosphatidylglycerol:prolipoprotein diacylglycerol transferase